MNDAPENTRPQTTETKQRCSSCGTWVSRSKNLCETCDAEADVHNALTFGFVQAARSNPWISEATDPPFSFRSISFLATADDLADVLQAGNWTLGQGFAVGDVCFINQVDGGDEWLVICGSLPFESYTYETPEERDVRKKGEGDPARERLRRFLADVQAATDEQLRTLTYGTRA